MIGRLFSFFRSISSVMWVRVAGIVVLAASVWLYWLKEPPYTAFFWDQHYFGWAVKILFGLEWRDFLTGPLAEKVVRVCTMTSTGVLALGLVSAIGLSPRRAWLKWPIYASGVVLVFEAFCAYLDVSYQIPMFIEHALRFGVPFFVVTAVLRGITPALRLFMLIATALTFCGHGIYALGHGVPVPGSFVDMVMQTLGLSQSSAKTFLFVAGVLDQLLVLMLLWIVLRPWALLYGIVWGFATSFARITSYVRFDVLFGISLLTYFPEFLVRTPHYLIPLVLWMEMRRKGAWGGGLEV